MTDQERHKKIAQALKTTATESDELLSTARELMAKAERLLLRSRQLLTLADEFDQGRYLLGEADGAIPDPQPADGEHAPT